MTNTNIDSALANIVSNHTIVAHRANRVTHYAAGGYTHEGDKVEISGLVLWSGCDESRAVIGDCQAWVMISDGSRVAERSFATRGEAIAHVESETRIALRAALR